MSRAYLPEPSVVLFSGPEEKPQELYLRARTGSSYSTYIDSLMVGVECPVCGSGGGNPVTYQPICLPCNVLMLPSTNGEIKCNWQTMVDYVNKRYGGKTEN